ncbi:SWIM zinc finger family protein [Ferroglobus placidus]|uniref:SWIM zinc finger family protein n=1 Tax=Ferroglobus placidus TaxID=54261 RepID=UPI0001B7488C|nr:SWIM zinc finger family protein [Ferroglobus placidus]
MDLRDLSAICSCQDRYNCKHAIALVLSYLNGKFVKNNTELAKAYPIAAASDVESVIMKILKFPSESDVLEVVRLLRLRGKEIDKDF